MIFYLIVADSTFSKLPKNTEATLIVDDAIVVPDLIKKRFKVIPIKSCSKQADHDACTIFTEKFEKNDLLSRYSSDIEPHINGIYEYVISSINNILFTIESVATEQDVICLIGGHHKLRIGACYAVKSPEFNQNVFFDRADVLNPFLFEALKSSNKRVKYHQSFLITTLFKYVARVVLLFCYSFLFTLKKYIVGCINTKDKQFNIFKNNDSDYILFPVRSNPQFDFASSIAQSIVSSGSKIKPLVLYYEMLMGAPFYSRLSNTTYPYISLFRYEYILTLLFLPISIMSNVVKLYLSLRKQPSLLLFSEGYSYSLPLSYLVFENLAAPQVYFYEKLLDKIISSLSDNHNINIHGVCSTEMIGTQAFVERAVTLKYRLKIVNIQTSVVYDNYYPVKAVGNKTFCLSEKTASNFNEVGINNKGHAEFIGKLKYLTSNEVPSNKVLSNKVRGLTIILYASQPYEPELTCQFLLELSHWLNENRKTVKLRVRLHPRDNIAHYSALKNVEFVLNDETIAESIKSASLVLTRTSSVVLDAIGYKIPYFVCKLSNFDLNVNLPFLKHAELTVSTAKELTTKLLEFHRVTTMYQEYIERQEESENKKVFSSQESISKFLVPFDKSMHTLVGAEVEEI
jgi:hypothetical protein